MHIMNRNIFFKWLPVAVRSSLLIVAAAVCFGCKSRSYVLQSVKPHRMEVTKALDANPLAEAEAFITRFRTGVDSLRSPYIGQSAMYMAAKRPESLLSNWVADALVAVGERQGYKPDLGVCNMGGLRAAMPEGTVRRGDILAISPFDNFFTILKMKGSDITALFHDIAALRGEGVSSSAHLEITHDGQLRSATLGGKPIEPERIYTIATIDYLADGNDKFYSFKRAIERIDSKELMSDLLMSHLRALDQQGQKATSKIEGRITIVDEDAAAQNTKSTASGKDANVKSEQVIRIQNQPYSATKTLLIVHSNDTHSCIEPLSPLLADTANADKGGYLRRAALLRDLRKYNPDNLLLVDAGDFSQGSAYYSLYHGDVEVGLMNLMRYDAATIGNHEFDFGLDNMARIFRQAQFPIVCCNYDFTGTPVEGLVKPYTIVRRAGLKIGILGVSPQLEGLVAAHTCEGVRFTDPIAAVQPVADYLRNVEHCDLVVCLSHLGWKAAGVSDEELIPATRNIDVVIGGHTHTYFQAPEQLTNLDGRTVIDNQMGKNGRFIGTLSLTMVK